MKVLIKIVENIPNFLEICGVVAVFTMLGSIVYVLSPNATIPVTMQSPYIFVLTGFSLFTFSKVLEQLLFQGMKGDTNESADK